MSTPSTEKSAAPGQAPPDFTPEGRSFYDRCRLLVEDAEGPAGESKTSDIKGFLSLVLAELPRVFDTPASDGDIEVAFQIINTFIGQLPTAADANAIIRLIGSTAVSGDSRAALRLRILASVFSGCEAVEVKVDLFDQLLTFAVATGQVAAISANLDAVPGWFKSWGLSNDQQAPLFLRLASVWEAAANPSKSFESLLRYLTLAKAGEERDSAAVKAVAAFTTVPAQAIQANLYKVKAVAALGDSPAHKAAVDLLHQYLHPSVPEFDAFASANAAYLASIGVDVSASSELVKVLALNNILGSVADDRSVAVPLADIAAQLQVPPEAVPAYVISGVEAGVFEAQLDEVEQAVYPSRSLDLVFEEPQWEALRGRLAHMSSHVHDLLASLSRELGVEAEEE